MSDLPRMKIETLGSESFSLPDQVHRLVTFLNKTLKRRDLIFGLNLNPDGTHRITIYEVVNLDKREADGEFAVTKAAAGSETSGEGSGE